jgi:hypothetical protein
LLKKAGKIGIGWAIVVVTLGAVPLRADPVTYFGIDPGVGPGPPSSRPQSTATAGSFDAAAGALGTVHTITFEGLANNLPGGDGTPLTVATGVTLTTSGTDHKPFPGFNYGTSNGSPTPVNDGYSITSGAKEFFEFVPQAPTSGVGTASMDFKFLTPINAFGLYLTGLGNIAGNSLYALFNDGTPQKLSIAGSSSGGVEFWGFTDHSAPIKDVTFQLIGATPDSRDVFGIDGVRFVSAVPEPSAAVLTVLCALGLLTPALARRIMGWDRRGG